MWSSSISITVLPLFHLYGSHCCANRKLTWLSLSLASLASKSIQCDGKFVYLEADAVPYSSLLELLVFMLLELLKSRCDSYLPI